MKEFRVDRQIVTEKWIMGEFNCVGDQDFKLATLENPWLNNEPYISCIPNGNYCCKRVDSPRFGNTFEITGVDGRSHILFHWGNYEKDTLGCILLGMTQVPDLNMISKSRMGFGKFIKYTQDINEFMLHIVGRIDGR